MTTRHNLRALFKSHDATLVQCPECPLLSPMSLADFRKTHASGTHHLTRNQCAFCFGQFTWAPRSLSHPDTVKHQRTCFHTFRTQNKYVPPEPEPEPVAAEAPDDLLTPDVCHPCRDFDPSPLTLNMCGRNMVLSWERNGFYDPIFRKPEWWHDTRVIPFDPSCGIGQDTGAMLKRFAEFTWYHISVKPFVFPYFKTQLASIQDHLAVLPYECLCDGLETSKEHDERTHRHMILVVRPAFNSQFRSIWEKKVLNPKYKGILSKILKEIKTRFHLVCCIKYLGQPYSTCDGKHLKEEWHGLPSHHRISRVVYPHAEAGMCALYPGGVQDYIQAHNKLKNVLPWMPYVQRGEGKTFKVPLSALHFKYQNCVIPVRRDLKPCAIVTKNHEQYPYKLWYDSNTCLVFEQDEALLQLSKEDWYVAQKMGKNYLFGAILTSFYQLTYAQQRTMSQLKQLNHSLQGEMQETRRIYAQENKKLHHALLQSHQEKETWQGEAEKWKREAETSERDKLHLQEENGKLQRENVVLRREKVVWKAKEESLLQENDTLKKHQGHVSPNSPHTSQTRVYPP